MSSNEKLVRYKSGCENAALLLIIQLIVEWLRDNVIKLRLTVQLRRPFQGGDNKGFNFFGFSQMHFRAKAKVLIFILTRP